MGPKGCPETTLTNYKSALRIIQQERRSQIKLALCKLRRRVMREDVAPHNLYLRTKWRRMVYFTFLLFYPQGKIAQYTLGGPKSRSGLCQVQDILFPLPGIEPRFLGRSVGSIVIINSENIVSY
jgi:hypothetical protein